MMRANRRGFTLIELLIGVVLLLIVGAGLYSLLVRTQRISREQSERADLQSNARAGTLILAAELREVGYDDSLGNGTRSPDILGIATDSIAFRAIRSSGIICATGTDKVVVDTTRNYSAYRIPVAGRDTLMMMAERDITKSSDDIWIRRRITNVKAGTCSTAFGSRAGIELATKLTVTGGSNDSIAVGSPMRTFEPVVYKLYTKDGKRYLGTYSVTMPGGESVQPVLGPLATNGFRLNYYDSVGSATTTLANIRSVRVKIVGMTDQNVVAGGSAATPTQKIDSLQMVVTLRNTLR